MPASIIVAFIGAVAAVGASFFTASATSDSHVSTVDTKVQVLEERQNLQYQEVTASLDRIEKKLDSLEPTARK